MLEAAKEGVGGVGSSTGLNFQITTATEFAEEAGPANGIELGNMLQY